MTKDVLVSISGLHTDVTESANEENEAIEVVNPASYYFKNGKHYVLYEEVVEGVSGTIKNKIKLSGHDSLEITKTGISNTHMIFEKNKKNQTYYTTPYGQMLVGVTTRKMDVHEEEDKIEIFVEYELDVNHEPMAESTIKMQIVSKEAYVLNQ